MAVYYNELDPYCAEWLRNLIAAGELPAGDVDERDIRDVRPVDLQGYRQCHFFAGVGGWPLALRLAGWDDDAPVWTGSCPCQPFSAAGRRLGTADERHLWPFWHFLIEQCRPPVVFGEQVASKAGRDWLSGVRADMEALGHVFGAADLCAAGVGAPHIRQRLWWVADAHGGHPGTEGLQRSRQHGLVAQDGRVGRLGDADGAGRIAGQPSATAARQGRSAQSASGPGFWSEFDVIPCADGKARRIEPGTFPLVARVSDSLERLRALEITESSEVERYGAAYEEAGNAYAASDRVGKLRAWGNAIVPQIAAVFVRAWMECAPSRRVAD